MRQFNIFSAVWRVLAFRSAVFVDIAKNWRGIGMLYLMMLLTLTWLLVCVKNTVVITNFLNHEGPAALKDFPTIKIVDGVASSDCQQPYTVKDERGETLIVFDTTGQVTMPSQVKTKMLITSTEIIQEDDFGRIQRTPIKALFQNETVDQVWLLSWVRLARNLIIPLGVPLLVTFSLAWRLLFAMLYALIGLGICSAFKIRLPFAALMRLAITSMTAAIVIDTLLSFVPLPPTCGIIWLLLQLLTIGYLVFAIKAVSKEWPRLAPAPVFIPGANNAPTSGPSSPPPPLPPQDPQYRPQSPQARPGDDLFP